MENKEKEQEREKKQKTSQDVIDLVVARLKAIPPNVAISFGNEREAYDVEDLIQHVIDQDDLGERIVDIQLNYLRSFGELVKYDDTSYSSVLR